MRVFLILSALLIAGPAAAQKAEDYLGSCAGAEPPKQRGFSSCDDVQQQFKKQFPKAMRGDYTSQRNVAFWLGGRESEYPAAIIPNQITACAWRFVILASGSPEVDTGDVSNLKYDCDKLDPVGVAAAQAQANALAKKIRR